MSDANRTSILLDRLNLLLTSEQERDLRFGQVIHSLTERLDNEDILSTEDDKWLEAINQMIEDKGLEDIEEYIIKSLDMEG